MGIAQMTFVETLFLPVAKTGNVGKVKSAVLTAAIPPPVGATLRLEA